MLAAFTLIAWSADASGTRSASARSTSTTRSPAPRDVSVLLADLQGFTNFSERHAPDEVSAMLNEYFDVAIPPIVERYGGAIHRIIGDSLMVVFNRNGDQPEHAMLSVKAAIAIQSTTSEITARHDDWPRFRVGINTGDAAVGIVGTTGGRTYTVIGDTVNLASRLEGQAVRPEVSRRIGDGPAPARSAHRAGRARACEGQTGTRRGPSIARPRHRHGSRPRD